MPNPITPVRFQDMPYQLFNPQYGGNQALSALQAGLLGIPETQLKEAARKIPAHVLDQLDQIYRYEDAQMSSFNQTVLAKVGAEARVFGVPPVISDGELLQLKAGGLLTGAGRKVSFTERGRKALAERWMNSSNNLRENRAKPEYVHPTRNADTEGGMVRKASKQSPITAAEAAFNDVVNARNSANEVMAAFRTTPAGKKRFFIA